MTIMEAMQATGKECLPRRSSTQSQKKGKRIAGWSEHVRPYADESKFWYQVWCSYWKPREGPVFENMKHSNLQLEDSKDVMIEFKIINSSLGFFRVVQIFSLKSENSEVLTAASAAE